MTRLAKYSADLYVKLEAETGASATGMRQCGSITHVALTEAARNEIFPAGLAGASNNMPSMSTVWRPACE
jgi:hypothetical protein